MATFNEASTIQSAIVARVSKADIGWRYVKGSDLHRTSDSVLLEQDVVKALTRFNPVIAAHPGRIDEILPQIRAALLSVGNDGLVASNERLVDWLRGNHTHRFAGTDDYLPIKVIDFDDLSRDTLIVSDEVTFVGLDDRRFDVVLWVNGFPFVVGETKTPVSLQTSWLDAAMDITETYEQKAAPFFVPNVLSFASDGREFRYGAVGQPPEMWLPWGSTKDPVDLPPMKRALRSVELLLRPEMILEILRNYTLFTSIPIGPETLRVKIIPRYPQVEGVEAIVARAADPKGKRGLLW